MAKKAKKTQADLPIVPLPDLVHWWESQQTPGVIIGGLAVSLQAEPRITRDIDGLVLVPAKQWPAFQKSARQFGFVPRRRDNLAFARNSRMLLFSHAETGIDVDVSMGELDFEQEIVARAKRVRIAGVTVPLATPEDLILLKAIAHRDQDMLDIDGLIATHPSLDEDRVRRWARIFAEGLERAEIYTDVAKRLTSRAKTKPRGRRRK